jgi:hypothetical protein
MDEQTDIGSILEVTYFAKKVGLIYVTYKCSVSTPHRTQFITVIKTKWWTFDLLTYSMEQSPS